MNQIKNIIYTAGMIKNNSSLIKDIPYFYPNIYAHHMTIQYGNFEGIELPNYIGKEFIFTANKEFSDDNAIALTGDINDAEIKNIMNANNQHAHITIATASGIKPVYSNKLIQTNSFIEIDAIPIKMKASAFVIFENGSKGWI